MHFIVDPQQSETYVNLYQPIFSWIEPDLKLFTITERRTAKGEEYNDVTTMDIPSLSVVLFLHEQELLGNEKITMATKHFEKEPWKFHHTETVSMGKINPYPHNNQNYYYTCNSMPLWAARQVHYGKEHIRLLRFVSHDNWEDQVDFYKLIVNADADAEKMDFCLFTMYSQGNYDIQLALKRLPPEIAPRPTNSAILQLRVPDVGQIVPLFPNVCSPLSDTRWQTTDYDGNTIILQVTNTPPLTGNFAPISRPVVSTRLGFFV